jgi:hypothetical protein
MPVIAVVHCVQAAAVARRTCSARRPVRQSPRHAPAASLVPIGSAREFARIRVVPAHNRANGH